MANKYSTIVQWSEADGAFIATVPEFPHLSSFGDTSQQAVDELRGVIDDAVDILEQEGGDLPAPQELPQSSGQFRVRLPRSLHQRLVERARIEDVSLNQLVVAMVAEGLGRYLGSEASTEADVRPWPPTGRRPARSA
jgi:predicted RNase H-like HicB family nuclease